MSTVEYSSWTGDISAIGAMYPFVELEWLFFTLCVAFWIIWHIVQIGIEEKELREEAEFYKKESLKKIILSRRGVNNP